MDEKPTIKPAYVKPLKRICMSIGELPTAYLETMTYYEMLIWFIEFMRNTMIPTINNNSEAVQELQGLYEDLRVYVNTSIEDFENEVNTEIERFEGVVNDEVERFEGVVNDKVEELEDYMNNYFDNLDVQEEINNKLDDMLEDGVLEQIIEQYIQSSALWCFDNVADMKLATNFVNGSYAKTLGYYSKNDGGESIYKIRNIESGETTDEKYKIEISQTLLAELIIKDNRVNIIQLGAKNDGTADVGGIINEALNKDLRVYVPSGTYLITTTIHPKGYNELIIDGDLNYTGIDSCIKIDTNRNYIQTKNITTTNGIPVLLENSDETATKCSNNMLYFNGTLSSSNNHAMYLHAIARGIAYNEIHFYTLEAGSDKYSLYIKTESEGAYAKYVNENVFYGGRCSGGTYGIYIDTNINGTSGECNGLKFYNVALEGITNGIYINNGRANFFEIPRVAEISSNNKILTINGKADGNTFNIVSLIKASMIDISGLDNGDAYNNFINGEIITNGGERLGRNFISRNKRLQLERLLRKISYGYVGDGLVSEGYIRFDNDYYRNYLNIQTTNNPTIILNQYFGSQGINEIFVRKDENKSFVLKDNYENTITSHDGSSNLGYEHWICYDLNGTDTWIKL